LPDRRALAQDIAATFAPIFNGANGAHSYFRGVEPTSGNARMIVFYGHYRINATAGALIAPSAYRESIVGLDTADVDPCSTLARPMSDACPPVPSRLHGTWPAPGRQPLRACNVL